MNYTDFENIINGRFERIPELKRKVVRIFLSSTFTGNFELPEISVFGPTHQNPLVSLISLNFFNLSHQKKYMLVKPTLFFSKIILF